MLQTHKNLDVWKRSIDRVTSVYQISESFPEIETFGITNQMRRAAVSVPSNIAEGACRQSNKEYIQFLYIALGSVMELETQLIITYNLSYLDEKNFNKLSEEISEIGKMLNGLIKYRKSKL